MPSLHNPLQNHLLAALPADAFNRLLPHLELVPMRLGEALYESGGKLSHVYFPTTAVVSLLYVLENGSSAEIAIVGNEGVLGVAVFMGGNTTPSRAITQIAGYGYRLKSQLLKTEFDLAGPMLHLLLRYTQSLITQMSQTAVCNRHHSVEQQLCRWLLLSLDRLSSDAVSMTQELIANMLGVRREGVTEAAGGLQRAGIISYSRGHIKVLDRPALERAACECYGVVKRETDRLMPEHPAQHPAAHNVQHRAQHSAEHKAQHSAEHKAERKAEHKAEHIAEHIAEHKAEHKAEHATKHPVKEPTGLPAADLGDEDISPSAEVVPLH